MFWCSRICQRHKYLLWANHTLLGGQQFDISRFHIQTCQWKDHSHWNKAVSAAEKVVGYPTSFMNLRFWLSDEMSNVAVNIRKLIGTKHPLMETAKGLLFDNKDNMQTRGLVVLLISKAAGHSQQSRVFPHHSLDHSYGSSQPSTEANSNGILTTQRSLAEITEMINTAFILHKGVMHVDLNDREKPYGSETEDLLYGNKMALLSGDYLISKASTGLTQLGNTYVVETMASAISDLMESGFFLDDKQIGKSDGGKFSHDLWEEWSYKNGACLYAKSCQSALMLSEHSETVSDKAFTFGKYFGFLRQMKEDTDKHVQSEPVSDSTLSLCGILSQYEIQELKEEYIKVAESSISELPNDEATNALKQIVRSL